jgi:nicotinamidase-related amidase
MDRSSAALVVVDMLNRYEHEDAEPLKESVRTALPHITSLIRRAGAADALVVYVNDNHGNWKAGRHALSDWALDGAEHDLVEPIVPDRETPFLVKARHSIFYATQLEYMLREQGVDHVVLAGQVTEQCILYSALDAYIRHFQVTIPRDAVAHIREDLAEAALTMMEVNMGADVVDVDTALRTLTA